MACRQLIQFPANYRDGELLKCTTNVLVDCESAKIIGEKTDKAWDAENFKFKCVTGFFINYKGIEYGSMVMNQSDFFAACIANCPEADERIHDFMHAIEFD